MTDSFRQDGIDPSANTLVNTYTKSVEMSRASKERILLEILSRLEAFLCNSRLRTLLIFFFITFRFIYKALLSYNSLARFGGVTDGREKNFLTRILV
jgi:hypothetical protein